MRFVTRSLVGLFLIALTIGLFSYAGNMVYTAVQAKMSEEPRSRPTRERVLSVNVVAVSPEEITPVFSTFGEILSRRTLDLRAPISGSVIALAENFAEGAQVRTGTLLVQIDPADAQSALDIVRTDLAEAEAELRDAERAMVLAEDTLAGIEAQAVLRERALLRQRDLLSRGVGTEATVETAELAASAATQSVLSQRQSLASAQARIERARTALNRRHISVAEAERRLADTQLIADFDGALSEIAIVAGGTVAANERVARLIDPTALEVSFRVSTAQYARLIDEQGNLRDAKVRVSLAVSGIDITAESTLTRASASVGEGQTGRLLFAQLDNAPGFRPGDFVTVTVTEPPLRRVAKLPATAVDAAGGLLVVGEGERLEYVTTEVLRRQGDDVIVSARGIAGREVIAERSPLLGAGIRIAPLRQDSGAVAEAPREPPTVALEPDRRARLIAFVEANRRMPSDVRERVLTQLQSDEVPAQLVERLESRMGS